MTDLVSYGPDSQQFAALRQPAGSQARPLVILIHGGFWRDQYHLDLMDPLADSLFEHGYATWNIEYRRVGPTGGGFPATLEDVARSIDFAAGLDWTSLAVIGHSAGGHLALWNASRPNSAMKPSLTVGLAPVADVISANRNGVGVDATTNFFGGDVDDLPDDYAAAQPNPHAFEGRVVILHGDSDDSVPLSQTDTIHHQVDRREVLPGVDHFDVINPDHVCWKIVVGELASL